MYLKWERNLLSLATPFNIRLLAFVDTMISNRCPEFGMSLEESLEKSLLEICG